MIEALQLARHAETLGEVPVGALIVKGDQVIGRGFNQPIRNSDPTAHAEIMAMRDAARFLGNYRLVDTTLYVTLEPCVMCAGAMVHGRIARLVFGASDPRAGAAGTVLNVLAIPAFNHHPEVSGGLLAEASANLLRAFFEKLRCRSGEVLIPLPPLDSD